MQVMAYAKETAAFTILCRESNSLSFFLLFISFSGYGSPESPQIHM